MARATWGSETQAALLALAVFGCASAPAASSDPDAPLSIDSIQEIEVKTSGASVECHFVEQTFAGQVLLSTAHRKPVPAAQVEFWSVGRNGLPEQLDIQADEAGRFEAKLTIVNHFYGSTYRRGRRYVTLRAPGCEPKELRVDDGWRSKTIKLHCPELTP